MSTITVETSQTIKARPETVFNLLSDYQKRPQLLTDNYLDYTVEQGGKGAGTIFRYRFRAARRERDHRMQVTVPQPSRELREKDTGSSLATTWTIRPAAQGQESDVTVTTTWEGSSGIGGFFERTFAPGELKRIYNVMLDRLALLAASGAGQPQPVG